MPELAACYFCGAALDESLSTVRLGDAPDATTVTLCDGCKEKLQTVLETVQGGAAESPADPAPAAHQSTDDASAATDATAAEADDPGSDPGADPTDDDAADADAGAADADAEAADAGAADADAGVADADAGAADAGAGTAEADTEAADAESGAGEDDADGTRSIVEGDQEISALEYNKVMRLLQNRDFPVDREDIVTVAANAYQVSRADCDRVIEVAIDRGLFDEEDGQLVRPD